MSKPVFVMLLKFCVVSFNGGSYHRITGKYLSYLPSYFDYLERFIFYFFAEVLLRFVRATRQINWQLHLISFRAMLPWFFACDRVNYARYASAYWLEMTALENTHPGLALVPLITFVL